LPRPPARPLGAVLLLALTGWAFGGCSSTDDGAASVSPVDPSSVVQTSFPDLATPTGEPGLAGIDTATPGVGDVVAVAGPFDDRFTLARLRVRAGEVSGRLTISSDVSDVLELQVLAGFYDADGAFLGIGRATFHLDEATEEPAGTGSPSELEEFRIAAPERYAAQVASATIGVPVLVNE
jgi:hypothetical protein